MTPTCLVRRALPVSLLLPLLLASPRVQAQTEVCVGTTSALYQAFADVSGSQTGAVTIKLQSGTYALGSDLSLDYRSGGDPTGSYGRLTLRGGYNAGCTSRTNALGATTLTGSGGQRVVGIELVNNPLTIERISSSNIDWNLGNWICYSAQDRPLQLDSLRLLNTRLSFSSLGCYDILIRNSLIRGRPGTPNDAAVAYSAFFGTNSHAPEFAVSSSTLLDGGLRLSFLAGSGQSPAPARVRLSSNVFDNDGAEIVIDGGDLYASHNRYDSASIVNGQQQSNLDNIAVPPLLLASGVPQNASPVVNAGTRFVPGGLPTTDLADNQRLVGADPDMGAFETAVDNALYLDVTNTNASGAGSLAQAVASGNAVNGRQVIRFNLVGSCPRTITLAQTLTLSDDTDILGETQPGSQPSTLAAGYNGAPCVILRAGAGVENGIVFSSAEAADNLKLSQLAFSGFTGNAVALRSGRGHQITGNRFGGSVGAVALLDVGTAIRVENTAREAQIGGPDPAQTNLIGNASFGIVLSGGGDNQVTGNAIGDAGFLPLPNTLGLAVYSPDNAILDNWFFHSTAINVLISTEDAHHNLVRDNAISGAGVHGLNIAGGANRNRIGPDNQFINNDADGIYIASGSFNDLSGNRYAGNGGLAIDLGDNGATPNDPDPIFDGNTTPNRNQNFPVLTSVEPLTVFGANFARIRGTLSSTRGLYRLDFHRNTSCDDSGHGEGSTLLGSETVELDCTIVLNNQCTKSFDVLVGGTVAAGQFVTAIATSPGDHSSEFSACREVGDDLIFANGFQ